MEQKPDDVSSADISTQLALPPKKDKKKATSTIDVAVVAKKKRRGVNILKVALLLLRRRSGYKPSVEDVASKGIWRRLVGSVRPLHLQSNRSQEQTSPSPHVISEPPLLPSPSVEHFEDVSSPPISPNAPKSSSSSSVDSMSRYASAVNLQELDQSDDEDESDDESGVDVNGGDEMIDAKAEEFIAQFYAQMRLQREAVHRYNERNRR